MAASEAQNVQRGILMILFINFALLMVFVCMRLIKKRIDIQDEDAPTTASKKYQEGQQQKQKQSDAHKQSQDRIDNDLDRAAVRRSELKEDATCLQRWLHSVEQFNYYYLPILILLPLNILTGTSKSFSLSLFFIISLCTGLFNFGKIHRQIVTNKCIWIVAEHLWLFLSIFYCINQWGATPIAMPYIVIGS